MPKNTLRIKTFYTLGKTFKCEIVSIHKIWQQEIHKYRLSSRVLELLKFFLSHAYHWYISMRVDSSLFFSVRRAYWMISRCTLYLTLLQGELSAGDPGRWWQGALPCIRLLHPWWSAWSWFGDVCLKDVCIDSPFDDFIYKMKKLKPWNDWNN